MKIELTKVTKYSTPLTSPIQTGRGELSHKVFTKLECSMENKSFITEISLLEGWSSITEELALDQAAFFFQNHELDLTNFNIESPLFGITEDIECSSEVRFAIENLLIKIIADQDPQTYQKQFLCNIDNPTITSALLVNNLENVNLELLSCEPIESLKVKIGRLPIEQEIVLVRKLLASIPNDIKIRLDGNQLLTLDQLLLFIENFSERVEFIEEPLQQIEQTPTSLSMFALDENLDQYQDDQRFSYFVVKPSLQGGFVKCYNLIKNARSPIIVSSAYDSLESLNSLAILAHNQNQKVPISPGLDTYRYLETENTPLNVFNYHIK